MTQLRFKHMLSQQYNILFVRCIFTQGLHISKAEHINYHHKPQV